jgi:WD40 repeat protein
LSGGRPRTQQPAIEALEDRLCLSIDLLVCSFYDDSVIRYDGTTGAFRGAFVSQRFGGLHGPHGLAIGLDGNVLVDDGVDSSVLRYDQTTGAFLGNFVQPGSGGLFGASAIVYGPDGNLYVSSGETHSIKRYQGTTGVFLGDFVPPDSGGLHRPHGLTFGPDGNLYVNSADDDSVMRYDGSTGQPLPAPGKSGADFVDPHSGGLTSPWGGLTFGVDGNLYVSSWGTNDVLRYDGTTGDFLGEFARAGSGGLSGPHGLSFGPDGNLYVVSQNTNNVLRYDGATGDFVGTFVPDVGHLVGPTALFFWDTGGNSPIGTGGGPSHHVTASAAHAAGLVDARVLVGLGGMTARLHDGNALASAALSSDPQPVNAVTPASAVWTLTADSVTAAIAGMPVSHSRTHAAADTLFGSWATDNWPLEPLAWQGGL